MTADRFLDPSVCRGYAEWITERLTDRPPSYLLGATALPYKARLTEQSWLTRRVLLRLANDLERIA